MFPRGLVFRLSMTLVIVSCACATGFHPKSANPYAMDPGPSSQGQGDIGFGAAAAVAGSAHRRMNGECFVACLKGTACNKETGLCDELPCRGECRADERCEENGLVDRCVPEVSPDLQIFGNARAADE